MTNWCVENRNVEMLKNPGMKWWKSDEMKYPGVKLWSYPYSMKIRWNDEITKSRDERVSPYMKCDDERKSRVTSYVRSQWVREECTSTPPLSWCAIDEVEQNAIKQLWAMHLKHGAS